MNKPKRFYDADELDDLANQLANTIKDAINCLDGDAVNREYRRDFDGVSQGKYLIEKLVAEILIDGRANLHGLEVCDE